MSKPFRSLYTRNREFESRVHTELTQTSRERLASITDISNNLTKSALSELGDEAGLSTVKDVTENADHYEFIFNADTVLVLSYVEHYFRVGLNRVSSISHRTPYSKGDLKEAVDKVEDVLITEGLLWEIEKNNSRVLFHPLESEAMEDIDKKVQAFAEEEPWDEALQGYNAAFERYLSGDFDELIPKKLYNSIEEVLKTICVDLEGWTEDREMSHAEYLDLLNEHNVYNANGITAPELGSLLDSLEKMVSKVGHDRKQRHIYHDRAYCTLLIHQVGAYLYFLIGRYDNYRS